MKKVSVKDLTLLAMFSAIIIAMTFIPNAGYITIPGMLLSITTLHIIVIIGCVTLNSFVSGTVLGAVWGITCILYAMANGTADAAIFLDPRISVIPRILVGFLTVAYYRLAVLAAKNKVTNIVLKIITILVISSLGYLFANNILLAFNVSPSILVSLIVAAIVMALFAVLFFRKTDSKTAPVLFAAIAGTFTNTALVLTAISLFASEGLINLTGTIEKIFKTVIALNGTVEVVAASIISIPCCVALNKYLKRM